MSGVKVDVAQIKGVNIADSCKEFSEAFNMKSEINQDDDAMQLASQCADEVEGVSKNLAKGMDQLNTYMNEMADEFKQMDESFAKVIEVQGPPLPPKKANPYANAF